MERYETMIKRVKEELKSDKKLLKELVNLDEKLKRIHREQYDKLINKSELNKGEKKEIKKRYYYYTHLESEISELREKITETKTYLILSKRYEKL